MSRKLRKMAKQIRGLCETVGCHGDRLCDLEDARTEETPLGAEEFCAREGEIAPPSLSEGMWRKANVQMREQAARIADLEGQRDDLLQYLLVANKKNVALRALRDAVRDVSSAEGWREAVSVYGCPPYITTGQAVSIAAALEAIEKEEAK